MRGLRAATERHGVTLIFDDGDVTRIDHINAACGAPTGCADKSVTSYGTYKVKNAFVLLDWKSTSPTLPAALPDLLYTLISCDDVVVMMESNFNFGEVDYQKDPG